MQARLNGKVMNQLAIFFSTLVMLQFVAEITGLTQNLDITYNLINTAVSYVTFSLAESMQLKHYKIFFSS